MCGRFTLAVEITKITVRFDAGTAIQEWKPRYNIAPGQSALAVISENDERSIVSMRFGFIPRWAEKKQTGYSMINAKAETIAKKPSYQQAFQQHRCLIPADGFYEWKQTDQGKAPYRLAMKNGDLFAFAGIWDTWTDPEGQEINTFAIITTGANALTEKLHDRMPVILHQKDEHIWLDSHVVQPEQLQPLLVPYPASKMEMFPVSPIVNSWRNDSPECIQNLNPRRI